MTANTRVESVVFVARADSNETKEAFRSSLRVTEQAYLNEYGPIQGSSDQFVFSHLNPSAPFPRDGGVREYFSSLLEDVEADDNNLIIVLNDWDGLTIDSLTFVRMFEKYADRITIRAYVDDPRVFWEANVADVCQLLFDEIGSIRLTQCRCARS